MKKTADTAHLILPVIAERWSTRAFDADRSLTDADLLPLFEAARWAASAGNSQPWRFVYGLRGTPAFDAIFATLRPGNQTWADRASVLMIAVAQIRRETGEPLGHGAYDLGQAMANLALEAAHQGLACHQMGGFNPEMARTALTIPADFVPMTAVALGIPTGPETLPEDLGQREIAPRARKPVADFAFAGAWPSRE